MRTTSKIAKLILQSGGGCVIPSTEESTLMTKDLQAILCCGPDRGFEVGSCEQADAESHDVRMCPAIPSFHHQASQTVSSG